MEIDEKLQRRHFSRHFCSQGPCPSLPEEEIWFFGCGGVARSPEVKENNESRTANKRSASGVPGLIVSESFTCSGCAEEDHPGDSCRQRDSASISEMPTSNTRVHHQVVRVLLLNLRFYCLPQPFFDRSFRYFCCHCLHFRRHIPLDY